ncbi:DUF1697 domain-containing protein [Sphingomonas sp. MMS24-J13]|uniref:DUF1697 domain-containing protein n=1 Tax=Sphingomonas sp. MMS24-J13 TaxID=3238686 RepID=UPI0038517EC6
MTRFIVLLRGINVNGRSLPMAELKQAARDGGFPDCVTYIQSGNLVLSAKGDAADVEKAIESLIEKQFGIKVEAIARSAADFAAAAAANPFPEGLGKQIHLGLTKKPLKAGAPEALAGRATHGEEIVAAGGGLWINFTQGVADSKLMPAVLDKAAGSTLTARNWNTVQKLIALAEA